MVIAPNRQNGRLDRGQSWAYVAQLVCAPFHPVDAEYDVQSAAEDRRKPGEAYPADGGANVTFVDQHVSRDADC